ncbi:MAG: hypothetical protein ACM3O6_11350 [Acidobacteriota bacterium]
MEPLLEDGADLVGLRHRGGRLRRGALRAVERAMLDYGHLRPAGERAPNKLREHGPNVATMATRRRWDGHGVSDDDVQRE